MRLLLPVHHFLPRYSAGVELYALRLAHAMQARGHDVQVVAIERIDEGQPGQIESGLDGYQGVPVWRLRYNLLNAPERPRWNFDNPLLEAWFRDHLDKRRPTLVHFHSGYLMGAGPLRAVRQAGVPMVLTMHDYWFLCPRHTLLRSDGSLCTEIPADPGVCARCVARGDAVMSVTGRLAGLTARMGMGRLLRLYEKTDLAQGRALQLQRRRTLAEALRWPAAVHVLSRFMAERASALVPAGRLHCIPCGVDPAPADLARPAQEATGPLRFGYTGQLAEHKGVHLLVQAFRSLPPLGRPVELHIHGSGLPGVESALRRLAAGDRRIHFHGRYDFADRWRILAGIDVSVIPSVWYESLGIVTLEAIAAGVPVIVAKTGGLHEAVTEGVQGLFVQPGSVDSLRDQMRRIAEDPTLLEHLRQGVRSNPPRRAAEEMADLAALYERVLAGRERLQFLHASGKTDWQREMVALHSQTAKE